MNAATQILLKRLKLTPRQAQVLHWMAEGKTNAEIAVILECSFFTVKNHLKAIFLRLGVSTRVGAAACAYRCHFAEASPSTSLPAPSRSRRKKPHTLDPSLHETYSA